MAWYYNSNSGLISETAEWIAYPQLHLGLGWHGPFKTKQDALNFYEQGKATNPGWKAPTDSTLGAIGNRIGLGDITDPLGKLNLAAWFLRIGEIILGLVLIGVGVAKLTGATNVISKAVKSGVPIPV